MDSGNSNSSHSRFPAKPGDVDPIHSFTKDVAPHFVGVPPSRQMQQSGDVREKQADAGLDGPSQQQGDGNLVLDSNVGGFG